MHRRRTIGELAERLISHQGRTIRQRYADLNTYVYRAISAIGYDPQIHTGLDPATILQRGCGRCQQSAEVMCAVIRVAGLRVWRVEMFGIGEREACSHAVVEVEYEKGAHLYDPTCGCYYTEDASPTGRVLSYDELRADPSLAVSKLVPACVQWLSDDEFPRGPMASPQTYQHTGEMRRV